MSYKVGDKFIVEIDDVMLGSTAENNPTALYRIKGFNSLVFDKNGLDKLEKIPTSDAKDWSETIEVMEREYNRGLNDAWELAKKLFADMSDSDLNEIFGKDWNYPKLMRLTPQEALAKIEAYEESKAIKVGDVVKRKNVDKDMPNKLIVTKIYNQTFEGIDSDGYVYCEKHFDEWKKTGKHLDIEHLLEQIRGNE